MDNKPKMDKKLTVLSELLNFEADKEFTIAEVIDRTEVNPQTVRTVLSRHSYLLEEAGKTETGKRGGQITRYRLNPENRAELEQIVRDAGADSASGMAREPFQSDVLAAVADTLLGRIRQTDDPSQRDSLLESAGIDLYTADRELRAAKDAGESTDAARQEWEELNACYFLLAYGCLSDAFTLTVKRYIVELAKKRARQPERAAVEFKRRFERQLLLSEECGQLTEIIDHLRRYGQNGVELDARNILLFGSSAALYQAGSLQVPPDWQSEQADFELIVMMVAFNNSFRYKTQDELSSLEKAIAETVSVEYICEGACAY